MKTRMMTGAIALLVCQLALATNHPAKPTPPDHSSANASADAKAYAAQEQTAVGGNGGAGGAGGKATGGASNQTQTATGGASSANNAGNTQSTEFNYPRQAPSTAQGGLMVGSCGAGGNAGGSNTHGSAFLGIAWTPADCKLLLTAAAYQSLGMWDSACEMINGISVVKARWKALGVKAPSCQVKPPEPVVPVLPQPVSVNVQPATPVDTSQFITRAEYEEAMKRQTVALTRK